MRPTIRDIAARAGTSAATVSMVLSGKSERISQQTRDRILAIARELNYRPNQTAVNLKMNRSRTLGLIVSDIRNDYYASVARGLEDRCRKSGMSMLLCNSADSYTRETEYIEVLDSKGIDGVVLGMSSTGSIEKAKRSVELLQQKGIPFVLLDRTITGPSCNSVSTDDTEGGRLAAEHLLSLGHTHIAVITGPDYLAGSRLRLSAFSARMREAGLRPEAGLTVHSDYSYAGGAKACAELLARGGFSAVFAFNDMMALGACSVLRERGLRVPQDVSVMGFDDIFLSRIVDVPLTTIRQPMYEIGDKAGEILCGLIEGRAASPILFEYPP
ncbi:MAG: LacI family DNA-binding transcriptional regulator, partial [Oscillospiraceae bacterium]|nr:LacI family DNA-binding transcriptional regulator [Oscillospiraceae bacterium]